MVLKKHQLHGPPDKVLHNSFAKTLLWKHSTPLIPTLSPLPFILYSLSSLSTLAIRNSHSQLSPLHSLFSITFFSLPSYLLSSAVLLFSTLFYPPLTPPSSFFYSTLHTLPLCSFPSTLISPLHPLLPTLLFTSLFCISLRYTGFTVFVLVLVSTLFLHSCSLHLVHLFSSLSTLSTLFPKSKMCLKKCFSQKVPRSLSGHTSPSKLKT
jgi:hypothetical protein